MDVFGQKMMTLWPKLAEPELFQYVNEVIPVEDPKCSFYNKNWEKRVRRLGEIGQNCRFWTKNPKYRGELHSPPFLINPHSPFSNPPYIGKLQPPFFAIFFRGKNMSEICRKFTPIGWFGSKIYLKLYNPKINYF